MSDPVSITGNAVGTVSLGITVAHGLFGYYVAWKEFSDDIKNTLAFIQDLSKTLEVLQSTLSEAEGDLAIKSPVEGTIQSCTCVIAKLEQKLEKLHALGPQKHYRRMLYPFRKGPLGKLQDLAIDLRGNLQLLLEVFQINALTVQTTKLDHISITLNNLDLKVDDFHYTEKSDKRRVWLNAPNHLTNHAIARQKHVPRTGSWFMDRDDFKNWYTMSPSSYCLYGPTGCGKTILSSTIIEYAKEKLPSAPRTATCFFYFDFGNANYQTTDQLLRSLLEQLASESPSALNALRDLYDECRNGASQPPLESLIACFRKALSMFDCVFIITDALDECVTRDGLMDFLESTIRWEQPSLHLLVTSRRIFEIEERLTGSVDTSHSLTVSDVDKDIKLYISQTLQNDKLLKRWDPKTILRIEDVLKKGAGGMFRWVSCQIESLRVCRRLPQLWKALANLPSTLPETYERILSSIPEQYKDDVVRVLQWLCFSFRPVTVLEISEALAIEFGNSEVPRFEPQGRLLDPVKDLLSMCSTLIVVVKDQENSSTAARLRLAHFSVKEYLVSMRSDNYALNELDAHRTLGESCLSYLLYFDGQPPIDADSGLQYPLARYAARYWAQHIGKMERKSHGAASVDILLERFAKSKPAILTYGRLYEENAEGIDVSDTHLSEYELAQPLYYMALAGMLRQTRKMIQKGADVNDTGGEFGNALQAASYKGHDEIVRYLIASGANVNQRAGYFCSPLRAAVFGDHASTVQILIESSANVDADVKIFTNIRSSKAKNPFDNPELTHLHRSLYAMRQDEPNIFYPRGRFFSALQLASSNGLTDMVRLLLDRGADINATDCRMRTALHCATSRLEIDVVSCLLRKGALVDGPESVATPLQELMEPIHHYWTHTTERFDLVEPLIKLLVRSGADLSRVSCYDALCHHYREGEHHHHPFLSLTYSLIEQGINIRKRKGMLVETSGWTALHEAAALGNEQMAADIFAAEVNPKALDEDGRDAVFIAMGNGNRKIANVLSHGKYNHVNRDRHGETPVFTAARNEDLETVKMLQEQRYDLNAQNLTGRTPLFVATEKGCSAVVDYLLAHGCSALETDADCCTLIHNTVQKWSSSVFRRLCESGCDVNAQDSRGRALLHHAAMASSRSTLMNVSPDEFRELMAMSVNPNLQDTCGQSFLHIFAERHLLLDKRWLEVFLDSGVDFNLKDDIGREPFSKPYYVSGLGLVEFPAFHGDLKTWILIRDALVSAHSGIFEAAVGRLPSIDSTGPDGNNALHLAVQTRYLEFVKNLVARGANINACNNDGKTPLELSLMNAESVHIMQFLITCGAALGPAHAMNNETVLT